MLETIILKLLNYLGDNYGFDCDDLQYSVGLNNDEVDRCRDLIREADDDI